MPNFFVSTEFQLTEFFSFKNVLHILRKRATAFRKRTSTLPPKQKEAE